ncbi:glycosyltransferase family 4 protein [Smaragdicoccus niigatensis]|uniref:glycosyltransferase family 4 protein n=1 Tax=Smaragdicoccus niigatensis TaxID=359359 RepID=UPI00035F1951|nr:glycosyltransferase family 1 protein [Smaragdicoccus niigatensis]
MTVPLIVDRRYVGNFGIGRYSREVLPRLNLEGRSFVSGVRPGSARDGLNVSRMRLPRNALLYSPGYSTGPSRCRQLLTVHDLTHLEVEDPRRRRANRLYYDRLVAPVIRRTGAVLTVSRNSVEWLREWLDDDRIAIINCGAGCSDAFTPHGPAADIGRDFFLYVGNLKEHKNPELAFAAMRDFGDHLFVVVTADREHAAELADRHDIADRTRILSDVDDEHLAELYRGASALLFPSRWEGFGLPVLEAMRSNTKVVYCVQATSVADICSGSQFAVEDSRDPGAFSAAMSAALDDPFVAPARLDDFDWPTIARKVEAVIRERLEAS